MSFALLYPSCSSVKTRRSGLARLHYPDKVSISKHSLPAFRSAILTRFLLHSSDFEMNTALVLKMRDHCKQVFSLWITFLTKHTHKAFRGCIDSLTETLRMTLRNQFFNRIRKIIHTHFIGLGTNSRRFYNMFGLAF